MPLLWLSLAFLLGVVLGEQAWHRLSWSFAPWLILAALCLAVLILRQWLVHRFQASPEQNAGGHPSLLGVLMLLGRPLLAFAGFALSLGALRYLSAQPRLTPETVAWYNDLGEDTWIEGVLIRPPDERDQYTNLLVRAERIRLPAFLQEADPGVGDFSEVKGRLLARLPPGGDWRYGDRLRLLGDLQTPSEDEEFSYQDYLGRQGVYSIIFFPKVELLRRDQGNPLMRVIYRLKARALETVYQLFPDPEASLLAGILLGVESGIPEDLEEAFRETGTAHIIAISGYNMTIVAGLLVLLFSRLIGRGRIGARWAALAAVIGIALYAVLVGGGASVVRAAIMGGLALLAGQLGRPQDGITTLAFVAALMALFNPNLLWDVGFQLSFLATLGLVLYVGRFQEGFTTLAARRLPQETIQRLVKPVGEYFLVTFAAILLTLPVSLYHFQRFSLIALIANPLVLPAQPPLMALGGLATLVGMAFRPLGQLLAYLAWPFVAYTIRVVELLAGATGGSLAVGQVSLAAVFLFYTVLFGLTIGGGRLRAWASGRDWALPQTLAAAALAGLALLTVFVWRAALARPDGKLHLTVLDIGTGDALLIRTPEGRHVLIDGGPGPSLLSDALGRRLPLGQRRLDYLVIAGTENEQTGALASVLERFPPEQVLWAGAPAGSRGSRQLSEALAQMRIPVAEAVTGQALDLGKGARLRVLAVGGRGATLLLEWGKFRVLLPVGVDFETLASLQADPDLASVTALLLAENGYTPANPPEWIERLNPQVVLLSVGAGNSRGLPDPEVIEAVEGRTLLRTDQNGWFELSTDGEKLWVEVERR